MDKKDFFEILRSVYDHTQNLDECFSIVNAHLFKVLPRSLYRYREVSGNSIDALENDKFVTVSATKFNDPYDTLVAYNPEDIKKYLQELLSDELLIELKSMVQSPRKNIILGHFSRKLNESCKKYEQEILKCESKNALADCIYNLISTKIFRDKIISPLKDVLKGYATMGCLCERNDSILMWSHYTNSHQGFLLEYDTLGLLETSANSDALLLPVDYAPFRYNATELVLSNILRLIGLNMLKWNRFEVLMSMIRKSDEWAYENEWRVIRLPQKQDDIHNDVEFFIYKPKAIYYGANMSKNDRMKLHTIALRKGIPEYEMFLDETSPKFVMNYRSVQ